jgi:hypothetical protein
MQKFWLQSGTGSDSYADNEAATAAWLDQLSDVSSWSSQELSEDYRWLVSFIKNVLLEPDRLLRPTAAQIFNRLHDMCQIRAPLEAQLLVGNCCTQTIRSFEPETLMEKPHWQLLDLYGVHSDLALVVLDTNLNLLASSVRQDSRADFKAFLSDQNSFAVLENVVKHLFNLARDMIREFSAPISAVTLNQYIKSLYIAGRSDTEVQMTQIRLLVSGGSILADEPPQTYLAQVMLTTIQLQRHTAYGAPFIAIIFDPKSGVPCDGAVNHERDSAIVPWNESTDLAQASSARLKRQLFPCRIPNCGVMSTSAPEAKSATWCVLRTTATDTILQKAHAEACSSFCLRRIGLQ